MCCLQMSLFWAVVSSAAVNQTLFMELDCQLMKLSLLQTELESAVCCFTDAAESEGVTPQVQLPHSLTDTKQENTNTDIQSDLITHILAEQMERITSVQMSCCPLITGIFCLILLTKALTRQGGADS